MSSTDLTPSPPGLPGYQSPEILVLGACRVNGRQVKSLELYQENQFWRWQIIDCDGREFLDGGNYVRRTDAARRMITALGPINQEQQP